MPVTLSRRDAIWLGLSGLAASVLPGQVMAGSVNDLITGFAQGSVPVEDGITLSVPSEAPDGFWVPVEVRAAGASHLMLLALARRSPLVARAQFGPASGPARLATRIRLAESQQVMALARRPDGAVLQAVAFVHVLVAGCAG
ncbi:thiosulfate oxidation carrier protein SoxY [Paracoccus indicus]|uniref:thiosulfate oxidation carrier protein SoxY n=1 Tax=Paracoccus indicus TaxID=2079229 RepID=UPI001FEC6187|nr:thiosulfate oxidation carrier protein SoxY [Paracoccus indicus]